MVDFGKDKDFALKASDRCFTWWTSWRPPLSTQHHSAPPPSTPIAGSLPVAIGANLPMTRLHTPHTSAVLSVTDAHGA